MMLTAEAAAKSLEPWLLPSWEEEKNSPSVFAAIAKLPKELREIGFGVFERDGDGKEFPRANWQERQQRSIAALRPLESLSQANRRKLLEVLCGSLVDAAEATWELLKSAPYQDSYSRRAFRAPQHAAATFDVRKDWLRGFAVGVARIRSDVLTPQWLAVWGGYLNMFPYDTLGRFLAAVINRGDSSGNEVFDILSQSVRNEHEIAGMSRMAARALLMSERSEGWELMQRTLLAAQRQEGLRQIILETVDEAHPQAFRRMLQIIHDEKLARFSAVTRAVDVWCGLNFESDQLKAVNTAISRAIQFLDEPIARSTALQSDDPEEVYFALWAAAYEDAHAAIAQAETMRRHRLPEIRFVTAYLLWQIRLPEASAVLTSMLDDDDLHVALTALDGCGFADDGEASPAQSKLKVQRFEQIEQLFHRLPEKPKMLPAIVWPWTERKADRTHVAGVLMGGMVAGTFGEVPPTRLLPFFPAMNRYHRAYVIRMLAEQKKWDKLTRETLMELTGNASSDVRQAAMDAMSRVDLTEEEIIRIEALLSRKASDLRIGAFKLLLKQSDKQALASAARLLEGKDVLTRLGGLELLRQMMEADRDRKACLQQAKEYAESSAKRTKDEQAQLEAILTTPTERLTLDDALGLMNPAELTPVPKVTAKKVEFFTDATIEILKSLDELVHEHREEKARHRRWDDTEVEDLLGTMWSLPHPRREKPKETEIRRLPLAEVWENWFHNRPASLKDCDGMELIRAERYLDMVCGYGWPHVKKWAAKHPDRQALVHNIAGDKPELNLKYSSLVKSIVEWLLYLHPPREGSRFLLDAAETFLARIPTSCYDELLEITKSSKLARRFYRDNELVDWRGEHGIKEWFSITVIGTDRDNEAPEDFERRWQLACYINRPIPDVPRHRPDIWTSLRAYKFGFANITDLTDSLIGPRAECDRFTELVVLTQYLDVETKALIAGMPEVRELINRIRERVLEIELARGDTPTPATQAALDLNFFGIKTLGRILNVIGAARFKVVGEFAADARLARLPTLTDMVKSTYPNDDDSQADFNREMKDCLKSGLKEQTILELMFLAPQWTKFVEGYFQWPGLSEGLYWFLAHMKYINADAESAATASGYEADQAEEGKDNRQNRSAWQRLIAERTSLTEVERANGAIDVEWFHRVYAQLTPKRWEMLAAAARFAATPAQAKRASYLGDVLLGKANRKELFAQVTQKKLKESVRLIGLYPLAQGARHNADLAQRYKMLVDYRRYAKTLSGLTKPSAMQALDIGFRNLASTAGYIDPLRLEWAMEADAVKDLAKGPVSVTKDGVTVTLGLDELARPVVATVKNDKPLKSVPPAIKKDKKVAELLERIADLRRQASRVKESLEAAMCRGDEFDAEELVHLSDHALLRPMLSRLLLVADDGIGYPDQGGKSLRDYEGKQHAVKKNSKLRLAHSVDLLERGDWSKWQHDCFEAKRVQPFKQIFRELYVVTKQEKKDGTRSSRYAGQQVNPHQANALWNARNWHTQEDVFKAFPAEGITASVAFKYGGGTPLDVEGLTFDFISFHRRDEVKPLKLPDIPPRIFSEVMRDLDLVVSVAHRGGVDPEATASTVEMREVLVNETCALLGLKNVKVKQPRVLIKGQLAEYAVHLGSGNVHRMPGGALCVIPVHAQHRGRLFLPFADDDPRTAEIISKVLLLAKDGEIQDPSILEQLTR
ncbi:MAG: DUF5724 domain-containing protein [Planctomycetaceae bacterium]